MVDPKAELVQGWLLKAKHDLATAKKVASGSDPILDTAIFHCQQAAEKAIKAFLVFHDQRFSKTHDIELLVTLAATVEPRLSAWTEIAESLTQYATAFRYPGEQLEPDSDEFEAALKSATEFYEFIFSLLPESSR